MVVHKRKKNTRERRSTTHGSGLGNKHNKGKGNKGGVGNAGSGKRGDAKKPIFQKIKRYIGKHGFSSKSRRLEMKPINIRMLEDNADSWVAKGLMSVSNGVYKADLESMGYTKLLATGNAKKKFEITVVFASSKAVEKLAKAGGSVKVLDPAGDTSVDSN